MGGLQTRPMTKSRPDPLCTRINQELFYGAQTGFVPLCRARKDSARRYAACGRDSLDVRAAIKIGIDREEMGRARRV